MADDALYNAKKLSAVNADLLLTKKMIFIIIYIQDVEAAIFYPERIR